MAKNEPNKPDDVKTAPANKTPAEEQAASVNVPLEAGGEAPAPEQTADNAVSFDKIGRAQKQGTGAVAMVT